MRDVVKMVLYKKKEKVVCFSCLFLFYFSLMKIGTHTHTHS